MFYSLKQPITKPEEIRSQLDSEQGLSLHSSVRNLKLSLCALGILVSILSWYDAEAQTFVDASTNALNQICNTTSGISNPLPSVGTQLRQICSDIANNNNGQPASSGVGTQSQPNSILISQQQLKSHLIEKEKKDMVQGGSADSVATNWGGKFSTFLTAGATGLRHRENQFEEGYNATIPSVTAGGAYLITDTLETGLAFNYSNSKGDYNSGGGFNVDSYSPLLYINYLPFENAYANLALGYTRQNQTNNRIAVANKIPNGLGNDNISFRRNTRGNVNANQYDLNFLTGYDHPVENFSFGPRLGVDVRQWEIDSYHESSQTGLELSYNSQYQTSIQSSLGLAASFAHSTAYGVMVPQLSASWVHEYSNNSRTIRSQFVQAPESPTFNFQTERPARNWAVIELGISFVMKEGLQAFANFSTVQGNRNFESYGGSLGMRLDW